MNKNLQSPTKLTEFAPIQTEEKPQTVGQFITKIFKFNKSSNTEEQNSGAASNSDLSQESLPTWAIDASPDSSTPPYHVDVNEGRSLPNVLKRISNLLALKSTVCNYLQTFLLSLQIYFHRTYKITPTLN